MEITSVLDEADEVMAIYQELEQKSLQISDKAMSEIIQRKWKRNKARLFCCTGVEMPGELGCLIHGNAVFTHVGWLSLHVAKMRTEDMEEDNVLRFEDADIDAVFLYREATTGFKRVRKELGWGKSETVGKKRKRGDDDEDAVTSSVRRPGTAE
jgi:hypothetical protein